MLSLAIIAAEPSKTPFYIVGGLLALWAVVLAGIGLMQPEFPYNVRGQRSVAALSTVLIIAAILAAVLTDP